MEITCFISKTLDLRVTERVITEQTSPQVETCGSVTAHLTRDLFPIGKVFHVWSMRCDVKNCLLDQPGVNRGNVRWMKIFTLKFEV